MTEIDVTIKLMHAFVYKPEIGWVLKSNLSPADIVAWFAPVEEEAVKKTGKLVGVCNCQCHCGLKECFVDHDEKCECSCHPKPSLPPIEPLVKYLKNYGQYQSPQYSLIDIGDKVQELIKVVNKLKENV